MARWIYLSSAAIVAVLATVGAYELLRNDGAPIAPELPVGSPHDAAPDSNASSVEPLREMEAPAPAKPAAESSASPADQDAEARRVLVSETVTLFDFGLHSDDFAHGERWQVGLGLTDEGTAFANDRISAVEIPAGLQATLFDDAHGQGFKLSLGPGTYDLNPYAFNDRTSSIEVSLYGQTADISGPEGCVVLYEHRGADQRRRGEAWRLDLPRGRDEWTFLASRKDFLDNEASTAWVAQGFELVLFDDPEGNGVALVLCPGLHELELLGFNDRASSARVRRVR